MSVPRDDARRPLVLEPLLLEKVWGGRRLESLGKPLPPGSLIGESWELCDLLETSASGAGGGAFRSRVAGGPFAGRILADVMAGWGLPRPGVLIKLLDAGENLSVQAHPSPAYARVHPGAHLKSECWLVLRAEPEAKIYAGLGPGVTVGEFARACRAGSSQIPSMLRAIPAIPGRCHVLPSGTVHALGAGVLAAEVQSPSDTTFRVYDWGRPGRALHVEQALEAMITEAPPPPRTLEPEKGAITTGAFSIARRAIGRGARISLLAERSRAWLIAAGSARMIREPSGDDIELPPGTTAYVPPAAEGWSVGAEAGAEAIVVEW